MDVRLFYLYLYKNIPRLTLTTPSTEMTNSQRGESTSVLRYGLLGGAIALPFTTFSYAQTHSKLSLSGVLVGGLLAGYLSKRNLGTSSGVGVRAGLIGALPVVLLWVDALQSISELTNPSWYSVVLFGMAVVFVVLVFGLGGFLGWIGETVGVWLAERRSS